MQPRLSKESGKVSDGEIMKAFLFDMDGVIVDSERYWEDIKYNFVSKLCKSWSDEFDEKILGLSVIDTFNMIKDNLKTNITVEEFIKKNDEMAVSVYNERVSLTPGFMDFIKKLSDEKIPLAIVSSSAKPWISMVLDRFSLRDYFSLIVGGDDVSGKSKPDPDIYLLAAEKMGVSPRDCIVIEDSKNGIISAKDAGMFCIGFKNGFNDKQDLSRADIVVKKFNDIDINRLVVG